MSHAREFEWNVLPGRGEEACGSPAVQEKFIARPGVEVGNLPMIWRPSERAVSKTEEGVVLGKEGLRFVIAPI